jgi:hypothetical protein
LEQNYLEIGIVKTLLLGRINFNIFTGDEGIFCENFVSTILRTFLTSFKQSFVKTHPEIEHLQKFIQKMWRGGGVGVLIPQNT